MADPRCVLAEIAFAHAQRLARPDSQVRDDQNDLNDWAGMIHRRLGELHDASRQADRQAARDRLIAIAELAVTAIESQDRIAAQAATQQ